MQATFTVREMAFLQETVKENRMEDKGDSLMNEIADCLDSATVKVEADSEIIETLQEMLEDIPE